MWVTTSLGFMYLGLLVSFKLPYKVNFDKLFDTIKAKFIIWANNKLSIVMRGVLVIN